MAGHIKIELRMKTCKLVIMVGLLATLAACTSNRQPDVMQEEYRPLLHFTPDSGWMNDPNGMVFYKGVYHLFYQYYPDSTIWGPMHWGHATSTDLVSWNEQPIALFPDSLGYIFSGSAVVDSLNTSGLGTSGEVPLVAIFTHHSTDAEKEKNHVHQVQSIAYSVDAGKTWTKYHGNPVLPNPGIHDFRDPKVIWHGASKQWIMSLAAGDSVMFYGSPNLLQWNYLSSFGAGLGAHGGVWECPDLFPMTVGKETVWVLLVNINPGAPNGGSGTQYFTGTFDGTTFTSFHNHTRWMDYGPDNYAGVTWSNTGNRRLLIGWMSNWLYGQQLPTRRWRSAMTIARELSLQKHNDEYWLVSQPVPELDRYAHTQNALPSMKGTGSTLLKIIPPAARLTLQGRYNQSWQVQLTNDVDTLAIGYNAEDGRFFIDRTRMRNVNFHPDFASVATAPVCFKKSAEFSTQLVFDNTSVELFTSDGVTMTALFFPEKPMAQMAIADSGANVLQYNLVPLQKQKADKGK